jgi:hypothetical protein
MKVIAVESNPKACTEMFKIHLDLVIISLTISADE